MLDQDKIIIEDGIYSADLRTYLWKLRIKQQRLLPILDLLLKIINLNLIDLDLPRIQNIFTDDEQVSIENASQISDVKNKEIIARWLDILSLVKKNTISENLQTVRSNYFQIFQKTGTPEYLIRSIGVIKYARGLFTKDLTDIFNDAVTSFQTIQGSCMRLCFIREMVSVYGAEMCEKAFKTELGISRQRNFEENDFRLLRFDIESLKAIGAIDENGFKKEFAETYLVEGNYNLSLLKPNQLYVNVSLIYRRGLDLIKSVEGADSLRKQLENRIANTQLQEYKTIAAFGVKMMNEIDLIDLENKINQLSITSFEDIMKAILSLPVPPNERIMDLAQQSSDSAPFTAKYFTRSENINAKGNTISVNDIQDNFRTIARANIREKLVAIITILTTQLSAYFDTIGAYLTQVINENNQLFVPKDRLSIYHYGLEKGFTGDFISAAHILIPQLENSFRYLATNNGINVTKLANELQHESLFSRLLEKIRPLADDDLFEELKAFMINNNDLNFRNEIFHGLMTTEKLQKYGVYVWWLSLKMIVQFRTMFPNTKKE